MSWFDVLFKKKPSAVVAKERLSIILAHERAQRSGKDFISALKEELIAVICKYTSVDKEALKVTLDRRDSIDVLTVDVVLPEGGLRRG
jgi:cell division topological specificity factor